MNKKIWDEKKYDTLRQEIGEGRYQIIEPGNSLVNVLYSKPPECYSDRFTCACIASGSSTLITAGENFICEDIVIPQNSQVFAWRTFRYCEHDRNPHFNADDNIIFPDIKGNIWKVSRKDSPDHYIRISEWAGIHHIAQAYHLPTEKQGPYSRYIENGASVPIRIECRGIEDGK